MPETQTAAASPYADAAAEILVILRNSSEAVLSRIPSAFVEKLRDVSRDSDHTFTLDHTKSLAEQDLLEDTRKLLLMIYNNYLLTEEESRSSRSELAEQVRKDKISQYEALLRTDGDGEDG